MKIIKSVPMILQIVDFVPEIMEFGIVYYSPEYNTANHLCPCGCGQQTCISIKKDEWSIIQQEPLMMMPSFLQRNGCKSHYIIDKGFAKIF